MMYSEKELAKMYQVKRVKTTVSGKYINIFKMAAKAKTGLIRLSVV